MINMKNGKKNKMFIFFYIILILFLWQTEPVQCQGWPELTIRLLSDDRFAMIEVAEGGAKTRHCPHHDLNNQLDEEQLIYVIGTFEKEKWLDEKNKALAKKHLEKHYQRFMTRIEKEGLPNELNLNTAKLTELVRLPSIGPVLAVKIIEYRETNSRFEFIDDIKKVEGIGSGTFNAIRHYITTN